jgi:hypothetical protein
MIRITRSIGSVEIETSLLACDPLSLGTHTGDGAAVP